ncbi:hypothetical protein D3C73_856140 [compost metagenome]
MPVGQAYADLAVKALCQLREDLRRTRVQAVGIGQGNARARPVRRQLAAQHFEHLAATGSAAQFMATAFDQQRTQPLEQGLVCFAQAGQAEQTVERLAEITQGLVRCDEGQARTLDGLLTVQPPQAIAQGQRFDLLQHRRETAADAIGLT